MYPFPARLYRIESYESPLSFGTSLNTNRSALKNLSKTHSDFCDHLSDLLRYPTWVILTERTLTIHKFLNMSPFPARLYRIESYDSPLSFDTSLNSNRRVLKNLWNFDKNSLIFLRPPQRLPEISCLGHSDRTNFNDP